MRRAIKADQLGPDVMPVLRAKIPAAQLQAALALDANAFRWRKASALASDGLVDRGGIDPDQLREPLAIGRAEFLAHAPEVSESLSTCQAIHYGTVTGSASELLDHRLMVAAHQSEDVEHPFRNDEVRRARLIQLAALVEGGLGAIAAAAGVSAANLDHIVKRRRQAKRADGSQPLAMVGDKLARTIEAAYKLTPGWLDWPFLEVDFEAVAKLSPSQFALLQGRLIEALRAAAAPPPAILKQATDRKAISDKQLEKHLPALDKAAAKAAHAKAERKTSTAVDPANPALRQRPLFGEKE